MNNEFLLDPNDINVVYDLRRDHVLLSQILSASLSAGPLGLAIDHGVAGSTEWWEAVRQGQVEVRQFEGTILRVDGGMNGDSLIVRIMGGRENKSWVAWMGFNRDLMGKTVKVTYSLSRPKTLPRLGFLVELIIQVVVLQHESFAICNQPFGGVALSVEVPLPNEG